MLTPANFHIRIYYDSSTSWPSPALVATGKQRGNTISHKPDTQADKRFLQCSSTMTTNCRCVWPILLSSVGFIDKKKNNQTIFFTAHCSDVKCGNTIRCCRNLLAQTNKLFLTKYTILASCNREKQTNVRLCRQV